MPPVSPTTPNRTGRPTALIGVGIAEPALAVHVFLEHGMNSIEMGDKSVVGCRVAASLLTESS